MRASQQGSEKRTFVKKSDRNIDYGCLGEN